MNQLRKIVTTILTISFINTNCYSQNKWTVYHLNGKVKELITENITYGGRTEIQFTDKGYYNSYRDWGSDQKEISREIYWRDNNGKLTSIDFLNGDKSTFIYYDNGKTKSYSRYTNEKMLLYRIDYKYEFNNNGKIREETSIVIENDQTETTITKYLYDTKGNLIEQNEESLKGTIKYFKIEKYDTLGRTIEIENSSNIKEDKVQREKYLFKGNEKLPIESRSYKDGKLWSEFIYTNDSHGNPIKIVKKNYLNESITDVEINDYIYDLQGNWIKKTTNNVYQEKSFKSYPIITQRKIVYY